MGRPQRRVGVLVGLVVLGLALAGGLALATSTATSSPSVVLPESPARQAGVSESRYIGQTSLSEVPGRLVTPVAAVDSSGKPLPDSRSVVAALRAKDGSKVTFSTPTIVDFGHVVAGIYTRSGARADPVSDFPGFFRTMSPGETGELTLSNGQWYVARYVELPAHVPIDVVGFRFESDPSHPPATLAVPTTLAGPYGPTGANRVGSGEHPGCGEPAHSAPDDDVRLHDAAGTALTARSANAAQRRSSALRDSVRANRSPRPRAIARASMSRS